MNLSEHEENEFLVECSIEFDSITQTPESCPFVADQQENSFSSSNHLSPINVSDHDADNKKSEENLPIDIDQRPTSRLRKTLSHFFYLFEDLEGYLFLKNESYVLTPFLFIRNFYHYFTRLKLENPEEILELINKQTPFLPPLTQEEFSEAFNHYLKTPEIEKDRGWVLDQQEKDRLKITRSCCEALQKEKQKIINEIINNANYVNLYSFFSPEKMSAAQKKVFLENLMIAHHIKEKQEFYSDHPGHYSVDETLNRLKATLEHFSKEEAEKKLSDLIKTNQQMIAENLWARADEEQIHSAWHILLSCLSSLKYANFLIASLPVLILPGWWSLVFFLVILIIRISVACYFNNQKFDFTKERLFLVEANETSRIERILQKIVSRRFHSQQLLFLAQEKHVIDLFANKKQDNEKNWAKFSHYFSSLTHQVYLINNPVLETQRFDEREGTHALNHSTIYHYVYDVNQKTQFCLILVTKAVNSAFCAALLIWGTSFLLVQLSSLSCCAWAAGLAASIASPVVFITLFLIIFAMLALIHYFDTRKRKKRYQQEVKYYLEKKCEYLCIDDQGAFSIRESTQWEKFECLRKEIEFLEKCVKDTLATSEENLLSEKYKKELNEFLNREGVFEYHRRDKTLEEFRSNRGLFEYICSRFMVFLTGGSYGFSVQYSLCKGNFFFKSLVPCVSLPVLLLLFLPLIIVNGIVNLLVNHFQKKQEKRLFFLEHLDAKLASLEDRKASLLCIATTLGMLKEQQTPNQKTIPEDKKLISEQTIEYPLTKDDKPIRCEGPLTDFFKQSLNKNTVNEALSKRTDPQTSEEVEVLPVLTL